jgi:hypothetical protein
MSHHSTTRSGERRRSGSPGYIPVLTGALRDDWGGYQVGILGNDLNDVVVEVRVMGSAQSAHPPVVRVSDRAHAALRADEALVFDWTSLAFCCAVAGELSLRPTTLQEVQRLSVFVPLSREDGPLVFAHRRAYPMLVGRDIEVDCRRRLGVRWFSSSLPPDLGLRTSFGRETENRSGHCRDDPASGAAAPLS